MALANALTDWSRQCGRSARPLQEETCPWFAGRGWVKDDAALKKYQQISKAPTIGSMATYG